VFSYVDPTIKRALLRSGKLFELDETGAACSPGSGLAPFISLVGPVPLPVRVGAAASTFRWYAWVRHSDLHRIERVVEQIRSDGPRMLYALLSDYLSVSSILVLGDFAAAAAPLARVHSNCLTGDVFHSQRCDCGPQLDLALSRIVAEGVGALVYIAGHEGRGIGLWAKAITYLLQDAGQDTYRANETLGLPADSRDFTDAGRVLLHFRHGNRKLRLLGNNPSKRHDLEKVGLEVVEQLPLVAGVTPYNVRYLGSKREHGHAIPPEALRDVAPEPAPKLP
jgi:GTP cyclohydrolase II